ncbi:MAG TPA: SOS response-associated peptidase [Microthrixaceae bacterium]|nr:SOS response-associated peptidase [Microthrixaceae bacterium]
MCGRFVSSSSPEQIAQYFDADAVNEKLIERGPNYNTAPTSAVMVVYEDGTSRLLDSFRWGLVPSWAKDMSIGSRMINSRAETIAEKPSFRRAFAKRRCIIPVDGFYEWKALPGEKKKQPYYIHRPDDEPFAFAGLWEQWKGPKDGPALDEPLRTCSIITTEANSKMAELHDRMPVILPKSAWDEWLSSEGHDTEALGKFLVPAPSKLITFHPVSTEVNNARNRGEHLMDEVDPDAPEASSPQTLL